MSPLTPYPTPVHLTCPHCGQRYSHDTMLSGNTCYATFYSDRCFDASMWYEEVVIIQCFRCKRFVWVRNMKEYVPQRGIRRFMLEFVDFLCLGLSVFVPKTKPLTLQKLVEALASNVAEDRADERYLRFSLWHLFNDRVRNKWFEFKRTPEAKALKLWKNEEEKRLWNENLRSLFDLLDVSEANDRLVQAEICREQGEFDRAVEILDGITATPEYRTEVRIRARAIRRRCQDHDPFVFVTDGTESSIGHSILALVAIVIFLVVCLWTFEPTFDFFNWLFGNEI